MTDTERATIIGRTGTLTINQITIRVTIRDARSVYGRTDYLVEPTAGAGQQWVDASRVRIDDTTQ